MSKNKNYKSVLFRDGKTLVFKSGDLEKRWGCFTYIPKAELACAFLANEFTPQSWEEYLLEERGKNTLVLNSFKSEKDNKDYYKASKRLRYRGFISKFGISPLTFKKVFNAIMLEIWAVEPYFSRYCYSKYSINESNVRKIHKNLKLMDDARKNNLNNIVPFILYSDLSAKKLSILFGDCVWKELLLNSHHKNNLIARKISHLLEDCGTLVNEHKKVKNYKHKISNNKKELLEQVKYYNKLPSTVLKKGIYLGGDMMHRDTVLSLLSFLKTSEFIKEMSDRFSFLTNTKSMYTIVYEAIRDAKSLNKKYSINWSKEYWIQKHSEYQKAIVEESTKTLNKTFL